MSDAENQKTGVASKWAGARSDARSVCRAVMHHVKPELNPHVESRSSPQPHSSALLRECVNCNFGLELLSARRGSRPRGRCQTRWCASASYGEQNTLSCAPIVETALHADWREYSIWITFGAG